MGEFALEELLRLLNAATEKGMIHWSQTAEEDTFRAELVGTGLICVSRSNAPTYSPSLTDTPAYTLSVIDQDGVVLNDYFPAGDEDQLAMEDLYKKARSQALDIDEKLIEVFDHLRALVKES